nr:putative UPF0481 protein At3g02645 [Ipomoea batatas]
MRNLEPVVRANYDKYLDLEGSTLDYIMAVDSLYLLGFLVKSNGCHEISDIYVYGIANKHIVKSNGCSNGCHEISDIYVYVLSISTMRFLLASFFMLLLPPPQAFEVSEQSQSDVL